MLRKLISGLLLLAALTTSLTGCGMDLADVYKRQGSEWWMFIKIVLNMRMRTIL